MARRLLDEAPIFVTADSEDEEIDQETRFNQQQIRNHFVVGSRDAPIVIQPDRVAVNKGSPIVVYDSGDEAWMADEARSNWQRII